MTSELGSALVPVALAFAVIGVAHSASPLGLVLAAGFATRVVLLVLGGAVADRLPRERVMLVADATRALTQATVALLLLTGEARVWQLLVLFSVYGAGDAFFAPASTGLVPEVAGRARLQEANALLSVSGSVATIAGPALAGVLVAASEPGVAFAVDAASFVVSSMSLALLRGLRRRPAVAGTSIADDLRDGWRSVASRTWVWTSIVYFAVSNLAAAPLFVLGPVVAQQSLGGPKAWGLIATCGGLGAVLGDAAALTFRPRSLLTPGYLALTTWALAPILLARPCPAPAIAAASAVGFAAFSYSNALWFTALQERIPSRSLSRVSAYDWLGSRIFQPLGYALAGPAGAAIGIPATLVAGAAMHAAASIAVALVPAVRRLRRHDGSG